MTPLRDGFVTVIVQFRVARSKQAELSDTCHKKPHETGRFRAYAAPGSRIVMLKYRLAAFVVLSLIASPALAERLSFDHRLSPPLKAVLDGGDPAMIEYNDKNPRYVTDVIAVRGNSAKDWTEALVIVARAPDKKVSTAAQWLAELRAEADKKCRSELRTLAEDAVSITFERRSTGCSQGYPTAALYRVVAGQRSLFLLAVLSKAELSEESQRQWRELLASAHLE
jgi:hypothetical protein